MALSKITIQKQPGETKRVSMDFSNKMISGELIVSIDNVEQTLYEPNGTDQPTTDLSFSGQVISGQVAQLLVAGGTIPSRGDIKEQDYKVTITVTTDAGQILENDGLLKVKED